MMMEKIRLPELRDIIATLQNFSILQQNKTAKKTISLNVELAELQEAMKEFSYFWLFIDLFVCSCQS